MAGTVAQLNVKAKISGEYGLPKHRVEVAEISTSGMSGDYNNYRHMERHDDPNMALLIMPLEMIKQLNKEGWAVEPGHFGENITTIGISYDQFAPTKQFIIGAAVIEITKACTPCTELYSLPYVGKDKGPAFIKATLNRRGWYAKVVTEGTIKAGDQIIEVKQGA